MFESTRESPCETCSHEYFSDHEYCVNCKWNSKLVDNWSENVIH